MSRRRCRSAVIALIVIALLVPGGAAASSDLSESPEAASGSAESSVERNSRTLPSSELQELSDRFDRGEPIDRIAGVQGNRVRVLIEHRLPPASAHAALVAFGATQQVQLGSTYVEASVPIDGLEALQHQPWVHYVQPAPRSSPPLGQVPTVLPLSVTGGQVAKTGASNWHAVGLDGTGVGIGIIDDFDLGVWNSAQSSGDLPAPAGTACFVAGTSCDLWTVTPGATHGAAVAEIVHEMAPGAALYLANGFTPGDLRAVIDYFAAQGVQVINFSATFPYDGPGDGTGLTAAIIDYAVSKGIAWINAAGNFAGGGYWRGAWTDADGDGWLEFAGGLEEMYIQCGWALGLRWDDWNTGNPTDYDVYIWDTIAEAVARDERNAKARSLNNQSNGADPFESFGPPLVAAGCANGELDLISVRLVDPGDGTATDTLEVGVAGWLEFASNPFSAAIPLGDTANPGALSVGAIDPPLGTAVASYSSRGPTNDGRIKPDLTAPAGMLTHSSGVFAGTSAAAPVVAGAGALLFQAGLVASPSQLKSYLLGSAVVERGPIGPDNDYGSGELSLGDPPNQPPTGVDDAFGGIEDTSLVVVAPGLLDNDFDPEGDGLSVAEFDASSVNGGTVAVGADGSFTYDPPADFFGDDTFSYTVSDGALSDSAEVTVTLTGAPDAPVGNDDQYAAARDTRLVVAAPGVLDNDSDPDGDGLTVVGFEVPSASGGSAAVGADGSFTYDPPAGFVGEDSFSYTVSDGTLTDTATVRVGVAAPPSGGGGGGGGGVPPPPALPAAQVACPVDLPAPGFVDLDGYSPETFNAISCLAAYDISLGTGPDTYSPDERVTRWQMALFLTRLLAAHGIELPAAPDQGFVDILDLAPATQQAISQLAVLGITRGTTATTFDPEGTVTRWQMALFLTRIAGVVGIPLADAPDAPFGDLATVSTETGTAINQLAEAGIARGTSATSFDPDADVSRWQMALFLARMLQAGGVTLEG